MELAKVTCKGQITLPVAIRRVLGLKEGDKVAFVEQGGQYLLMNSNALSFRMDDELDKADAAALATDVRYTLDEVEQRMKERVRSYATSQRPNSTAV
ncbi:MAG: AbrB/MazE/SpoVT family DNA-binding domain-containing protein [Clostridia bacterium]|nr:AbrB/MazE/SpoVT family DNA-binding domain-containing protein [Clostridia bacterium]